MVVESRITSHGKSSRGSNFLAPGTVSQACLSSPQLESITSKSLWRRSYPPTECDVPILAPGNSAQDVLVGGMRWDGMPFAFGDFCSGPLDRVQ